MGNLKLQSLFLQLAFAFCVFISSLSFGDAGITSTFIRSEWPSIDIPLDHEVFAVPQGYNAPQQVKLLILFILIFFLCNIRVAIDLVVLSMLKVSIAYLLPALIENKKICVFFSCT